MTLLFHLLLISLTLVVVLKLISLSISEKVSLNREELSPYECGFEHHNLSRIPFSLRYFFLTLIFLLFDLEIVLMIFMPSYLLTNFVALGLIILLSFLIILYLSLIYEWNDGTLEWLT